MLRTPMNATVLNGAPLKMEPAMAGVTRTTTSTRSTMMNNLGVDDVAKA